MMKHLIIPVAGLIAFYAILALAAAELEIPESTGPSHGKVVMCPVWTKSVISEKKIPFNIENVDLNLCTHLIGIDGFALKKTVPWESGIVANTDYEQLTQLRDRFKHLKVFLGVQIRFDDFVEVIKSAAKKDFMFNSAQFVLNNGLNGMNLEFEGSQISLEDFHEIVKFMRVLKLKFKRSGLELTVSFHVSQYFLGHGYDFHALSETVEFVTFNPTYNTDKDDYSIEDAETDRAVVKNVELLIKLMGVPVSKMLIGLHFEGSSFNRNTKDDDEGSGKFDKMLNYNDICHAVSEIDWVGSYDKYYNMAYVKNYTNGETIVFESVRSYVNQMRYAMHEDLAGAFTGLLNDDNYLGNCEPIDEPFRDLFMINIKRANLTEWEDDTFPLLKIVNDAIKVSLFEIHHYHEGYRGGSGMELGSGIFAPPIRVPPKQIIPPQTYLDDDITFIEEAEKQQSENQSPANGNTSDDQTQNDNGDNGRAAAFASNIHCMIFVVIVAFITS